MSLKYKENSKAIKMAENLGKTSSEKDISKIDKKLHFMNKGPVKKIWDKVEYLWSNIRNENLPKKYILMTVGALLYLISPLDIIPDTIPVLGLMDDVSVIIYIANIIKDISISIYSKLEEQAFETIDNKLNEFYKRMLINAGITFVITVIYVLIKIFQFFGNYSNIIARIVLLGNLIWFIIRTIIYIKKYGMYIFRASKSVIKEKNLRNGLITYFRNDINYVDTIYKVLGIVNKIIPEIPNPEKLVDLIIVQYRKRLILFISFIFSISALMFITKIVI